MSSEKKITLEVDILQYLYVIGEALETKKRCENSKDPVMKHHLKIVDGFLEVCRAASTQVSEEEAVNAVTELRKRGLQ